MRVSMPTVQMRSSPEYTPARGLEILSVKKNVIALGSRVFE